MSGSVSAAVLTTPTLPLSLAKREATIRVPSDPLTHPDGLFSSYK
jgi:hypothetical protein